MMVRERKVKCVVWDLDNTIWDGVLLEGDDVRLRPEVVAAIRTLDERGILHSIASRNDAESARAKLRELGIRDLFVHPQIGWSAKSAAVTEVVRALNIGADAIAFVDDDPFERDEVATAVGGVLCLDASEAASLPSRQEFVPRVVTDDARRRRSMVQAEIERSHAEAEMAPAAFLASLDMRMTIGQAGEDDLLRVEELTQRTSQLNSTGYVYSHDELEAMRCSGRHLLLVAGLDDRYGTYGQIGLALVEQEPDHWRLLLLLVSCRVMARGVGNVLLTHILERAAAAGRPLRADFIRTDRNRPMLVMLRFAGFREIGRRDGIVVLEHDLTEVPSIPAYVDLDVVS